MAAMALTITDHDAAATVRTVQTMNHLQTHLHHRERWHP